MPSPPRLWMPQHWPMWAGFVLFRVLSLLPWRVQTILGGFLGFVAHSIVRVRRSVAEANLRICFPEMDDAERGRLLRAHYRSIGIGLFETCFAWWAPARRLPRHRIEGLEHLKAAQIRGHGVLLLSAHFTTLEMAGRLLWQVQPMGALYRNPNNPVIARLMHDEREGRIVPAVHMDDLRGLLRALKQGHVIWYAPDQGRRRGPSVLVPFFGEPATTNTATSRLAQMSGAPVVPFFPRREADGSYTLLILPALEDFPGADPAADAARISRLIEDHVRLAPDQYFWVHRRFKARGPGLPDPYEDEERA